MGAWRAIVQRSAQRLPPSPGLRTASPARFLTRKEEKKIEKKRKKKKMTRVRTVSSGLVLSRLTPRVPAVTRAGGGGDAVEQRARGAAGPGRRRRERPRGGAAGAEVPLRPLSLLPFPDPGSAAPRGNWRWRSGGDGVSCRAVKSSVAWEAPQDVQSSKL